jgi:hypothetical protein
MELNDRPSLHHGTKLALGRASRLWLAATILVCGGVAASADDAMHPDGSNNNPYSFSFDQTIVDAAKVEWLPLEVPGLAPGAEYALLRGAFDNGSEMFLRLPPNYVVDNHNHTSDELYVWMQGDFTLIADDGTRTPMSGQSFISYPSNTPPHAIVCGDEPCIFYLRYGRPFDVTFYPMPE